MEKMRKILCKEGERELKNKINTLIKKKERISDFKKDQEKEGEIYEEKPIEERDEAFPDGSCKEEKAAFGVYRKKGKKKKVSYRVLGTQNAYNGELQGAIYAVVTTRPNTLRVIKTDNNAVLSLAEKIKSGKYIRWNKQAEPELARLLKERIEWKEVIENANIIFVKVKGHSGVKGNEEADKLAKKGLENENTYLGTKDIHRYRNRISIWTKEREIGERYREELKNKHLKEIKEKAKEDDNDMWKRMRNVKAIEEISNNFMKNKKIRKGVAMVLIKARTDLLPHAKQLFERKTENIKSPYCPWCSHKEENTEHIMLECPKYEKKREELREKIIEVLTNGNILGIKKEEVANMIPIWFLKNKKEEISIYQGLKNFDKLAGILGYIPKEIRGLIQNLFGKAKKDKNKSKKLK